MKDIIIKEFKESIKVKQLLLKDLGIVSQIETLAMDIIKTIKSGGKIIFCGNGGSFSDSQHIAAEFTARLRFDRASIPAITLGTNSSNLTAISNDYGYENIFSRELESLSTSKDLFIPISTSGNSPNIIKAIKYAKKIGLKTIGLTGKKGGKMGKLCNTINIPSIKTEKIQEAHIMLGHVLCHLTESTLFKAKISLKSIKNG